jgi:7-keto-8-aminopelargonate synthetase-like enzyme
MCFAPAITVAARRAIRFVDRENARREALKLQQQRARTRARHQRAAAQRPIMDQVIQTRKAR